MEEKPILIVKFPTRQRPQKFFETLDKYYELLADISNTIFAIICDEDDLSMNNPLVIAKIKKYKNCHVVFGDSKTKIEAVNHPIPKDMDYLVWNIILLASDDMIPVVQGYDDIIRKNMVKYFPDMDGVLWFNDGYQGKKLNTLVCMGKKYFDRFEFIYNPVYITWWCDNEFMEIANLLGKQVYFDDPIIRHEHPDNAGYDYDELYRKNNNHTGDKEVYQIRKQNNFFIRKVLIIQPGRSGDIIINLPIAKKLSEQNFVYWLCPEQYHNLFRNIGYVTPVTNRNDTYDQVIDLSFGFGGAPEGWWQRTKKAWFSFVEAKYFLAGMDINLRWNLSFKRNKEREEALLYIIYHRHGKDYNLVHDHINAGMIFSIHAENKVQFEPIEDYNIFDWYLVIKNAKEIHCIDSSLSNFIEAIPEFRELNKTIYITKRESNIFLRSIYKNGWKRV